MKKIKIKFYTMKRPGKSTRFPHAGTCKVRKRPGCYVLLLSEWKGFEYTDLIVRKNKFGAYQGKNKKVTVRFSQTSKDKFIGEWKESNDYLITVKVLS